MKDYDKFVEKVTENVQNALAEKNTKTVDGKVFEQMVLDAIKKEVKDTDAIIQSSQNFPDFLIEFGENTEIGIEVKKRNTNTWEIIGGSIYESLKHEKEHTYIIMGKSMGKSDGTPEVRYRRYRECISDLKVTHSPRFYLNLDLKVGEDYITKNNADDLYTLDNEELNERIRELLRTNKSTWYSEKEKDMIKSFADLSSEEKKQFFVDGVVLFPKVIKGDYKEFGPWMTYQCLVWCKNIRDIFSSGGTKKEEGFVASAVMSRILKYADRIAVRIETMTDDEVRQYWLSPEQEPIHDRKLFWIDLIQENIKVSNPLIDNNIKEFPEIFKQDKRDYNKNIIIEKFIKRLHTLIVGEPT